MICLLNMVIFYSKVLVYWMLRWKQNNPCLHYASISKSAETQLGVENSLATGLRNQQFYTHAKTQWCSKPNTWLSYRSAAKHCHVWLLQP